MIRGAACRQFLIASLLSAGGLPATAAPGTSVLLITLDTTRADHVGGPASATPNLDRLAGRGTRYTRALAPAPLTLPAHCSLLTGLDPPHHGVRDNGLGALPPDLPTLAGVLSAHGYATAAFVASRVLDRRFGLARGFATYDDRMTAEQTGEQGYPERDAAAVTAAAVGWLARRPPRRPFLLWVHYYDPHAPYAAPGSDPAAPAAERYRAELRYVDTEVGRLLSALPTPLERTLVVAVGDHGEMLGEHREREHGIFLYRGSLEVPLLLAGPGVPRGRTVAGGVPTRALAATVLRLAGIAGEASFGAPLPGLGVSPAADDTVYSETLLPATAYGWSPLRAVTRGRWRFVEAPRPELYDLSADPQETRNLAGERPEEVARLRTVLQELDRAAPPRTAQPVVPDAEMTAALRSLGYVSGATTPSPPSRGGGLDPKDGIALLDEFETAKAALRAGRAALATAKLEELLRRNPGNVPFLSWLADAQADSGRREAAAASLREAVRLNPAQDLLHLRLADAWFELGRLGEARVEYETTLALDPRASRAWLGLGELALRQGRPDEELNLMRRALASGTESALLLSRLAQIEAGRGELASAESHAAEATRLLPNLALGWWVWGETAEKRGRQAEAVQRYARAVELGLTTGPALLHLGELLRRLGRGAEARPYLERAARAGGAPGAEAQRLLRDGQ